MAVLSNRGTKMNDQKRKYNKENQHRWWKNKAKPGYMRVQFIVTKEERDYLRAELIKLREKA